MKSKVIQASLLRVREALLACNVEEARAILDNLAVRCAMDHLLLQQVGTLYRQCGAHEASGMAYKASLKLQPNNPDYLYNLANNYIEVGQIDDAQQLLLRLIQINPDDSGARLSLSHLRRQTADSNHVNELRFVLSRLPSADPGRIELCYALAKELEDLERYAESFNFLSEGAALRRAQLKYDIRSDEWAMQQIAETFNQNWIDSAFRGPDSNQPVFILGLPRSGTTLVDRILASHSRVTSLGEINTWTFALMNSTGQGDKGELIQRAAGVDFSTVGQRYLNGIHGFRQSASKLIDKTPLNFLYLGLINVALPQAKIIHLRRNPADSGYALFKTLFRTGCPYSYSQQEVARYYAAYHRLMNHWRSVLPPGAFLDLDYEELVAQQEAQTRRLLDFCELEFEPACLDFHRMVGSAVVASSIQVRREIHNRSVGLAKKYQNQLAPLTAELHKQGIEL